ncbi:MAG TPA: MgtC/SapB family protein [Ignavibacteriales bacterium]|nr:MgtC/SapB family protein [Ignavibacteriales bacterium]
MNEDLYKIFLSIFLSGLIGIEREFRNRSAGLRTLILISLGSTLLTLVSINYSKGYDPLRLAANIITGIGFLGAGAIFRDTKKIQGLTTASSIWIVSAIGIAIGVGYTNIAWIVTIATVIILSGFNYVEHYLDKINTLKLYEITFENIYDKTQVTKIIDEYSAIKGVVGTSSINFDNNLLKIQFFVKGRAKIHKSFMNKINSDIRVCRYKL